MVKTSLPQAFEMLMTDYKEQVDAVRARPAWDDYGLRCPDLKSCFITAITALTQQLASGPPEAVKDSFGNILSTTPFPALLQLASWPRTRLGQLSLLGPVSNLTRRPHQS